MWKLILFICCTVENPQGAHFIGLDRDDFDTYTRCETAAQVQLDKAKSIYTSMTPPWPITIYEWKCVFNERPGS